MAGVDALRRDLLDSIRRLGKPGGDPRAQKYLGSPYPVLGLSSPQMKGIVSAFARAHRTFDPTTVNALADPEPLPQEVGRGVLADRGPLGG